MSRKERNKRGGALGRLILLLMFGLLLPAAGVTAAPLDWRPPAVSPQNHPLWGVGYGGGQFVAVGAQGTILTSRDGETWSIVRSGTPYWLSAVAYGEGRFVVVGEQGAILTSEDGVRWTARKSGTTSWLKGVTYGGGRFVAVGRQGAILTSEDGLNWTARDSGTANWLKGVVYGAVYGGGRYTVVGEDGEILTSTDAVNWTARVSGTSDWLPAVAYANGLFVAVGERGAILTSADGLTWTARPSGTGGFLSGIAYGEGRFVVVGEHGQVLTSPDGLAWTAQISGTADWLRGVTFGAGRFVAVGERGAIVTSGQAPSDSARLSVVPLSGEEVGRLLATAKPPGGFRAVGRGFEYRVEESGAGSEPSRSVTIAVGLEDGDLAGGVNPSRVGVFRVEVDGRLTFLNGKWSNNRVVITMPGAGRYVLGEMSVSFPDMKGHWARGEAELMASKQVAKGLADGTFRPDDPVTRAQFASMLVRAMGLPAAREPLSFSDVSAAGWYYEELGAAVKAGIITGYDDGAFRPDDPVTREQVAAMLARALESAGRAGLTEEAAGQVLANFSDGGAVSPWARRGLALAINEGIMRGKTAMLLAPGARTTRAEAVAMIARYWLKD